MKDTIIKVVSYKRPDNNTCKLLSTTNFDWKVFVYRFDPFLEEYKKKYEKNLYILDFETPNLAKKRQAVLDTSISEKYKYCIMLDDDIVSIEDIFGNKKDIAYMLEKLYFSIKNTYYLAISTSYNISSNAFNFDIEDYKNICNNSIFNLKLYSESNVKYNLFSKCEDMEFTLDLLLKGYKTGRINSVIVRNALQGGSTNDGLFYRFHNKNRFIEEAEYMKKRYYFLNDIFEYDESHFKMNTNKLIKYLKLWRLI